MIVKGNRTIQLEVAVHIHLYINTANQCKHDSLVPIICYHLNDGQAVSRTSEYTFSQHRWSSASFRNMRIRTSHRSANFQALSDSKEL